MSAQMHVWIGDSDPYELPVGNLTIFIHPGTPPMTKLGGDHPLDNDPSGSPHAPTTLPPQSKLGGPYRNLIRADSDWDTDSLAHDILHGQAGPFVAIELPDDMHGTPSGRADVFEPILDALRASSSGDIEVHMLRASDLPDVDG